MQSVNEALDELNRSPAHALIANLPPVFESQAITEQLTSLPYDTPVITCWIPRDDETTRGLGAIKYLVKPVEQQVLLSTLMELDRDIKTILVVVKRKGAC